MKTITVTLHRANNYGAVLQAYALQQVQESIGYENKLLDYYDNPPLFSNCSCKHPIRYLKNIVLNIITFLHIKKVKKFAQKFEEFRAKYLKETQRYDTVEQLLENPPEADCYITGSDQVWNLNDPYFKFHYLDFGKKSIIKYSYAASMSDFFLGEDEKKYIKERLTNFKSISVREESVCKYIQDFTELKCQCNLDPVFLLDKETWKHFEKKPQIETPYILCYAVIGNPELQCIVNKIKRFANLPVVLLQCSAIKHIKADKYVFDADPQEFLGLINHATYVITTSFHGTALSIILEKNFYTVIKSSLSERMTDLLKLLNLSDRVLTDAKQISLEAIDYSKVRMVLADEIESAIEYLKSMKI